MKILSCADRNFFFPLFLGVAIGSVPTMTFPHSLVIWAETIDDHVQVETFLGNGGVPKQGQVVVEDENGKVVVRGQLDNRGHYRFPTPAASALTVKVILSPGHEGSFTLRLNALTSAQDPG